MCAGFLLSHERLVQNLTKVVLFSWNGLFTVLKKKREIHFYCVISFYPWKLKNLKNARYKNESYFSSTNSVLGTPQILDFTHPFSCSQTNGNVWLLLLNSTLFWRKNCGKWDLNLIIKRLNFFVKKSETYVINHFETFC